MLTTHFLLLQCGVCSAVFHVGCLDATKPCPKCERRQKREDLPLLEGDSWPFLKTTYIRLHYNKIEECHSSPVIFFFFFSILLYINFWDMYVNMFQMQYFIMYVWEKSVHLILLQWAVWHLFVIMLIFNKIPFVVVRCSEVKLVRWKGTEYLIK